MDALAAVLEVAGVHGTIAATVNAAEPWGLTEMWIEDPDGIRIVLVEVPADHPLRRAFGSAVTGPAHLQAWPGLRLLRLRPCGGGAATRHPGYRRRRRLAAPGRERDGLSPGGLRG